ncbi:MAG TPA: hypothetical protein DD670_01305 [Planctomycetaceae bacterium]|nr:hypothetical protein [Planctomycetaceae bacterium]
MPSLPAVDGRQAIRAFEKLGFSVVRIQGSHHIMEKAGHRYVLSVPVHRGTLRSVIRAADITVEEFVGLCD